ncbi:hypothetical protein HAX54_000108, partial [Datura stramonium]|nr:hypothetical protein [Datura stramonium]
RTLRSFTEMKRGERGEEATDLYGGGWRAGREEKRSGWRRFGFCSPENKMSEKRGRGFMEEEEERVERRQGAGLVEDRREKRAEAVRRQREGKIGSRWASGGARRSGSEEEEWRCGSPERRKTEIRVCFAGVEEKEKREGGGLFCERETMSLFRVRGEDDII